jgi:hypothetical protein
MYRAWSAANGRTAGILFVVAALWTSAACCATPPFLLASDFRIGGDGFDQLNDLVVDSSGNAYVSGIVGSYNFPGIDSSKVINGGMDLRFVAKIPPLGRAPTYVAVVGSPGTGTLAGLAIDQAGNAYVPAYESSTNYPVAGGLYQGTTGRKYVYRVTPAGQVVKYSIALDAAITRISAIAVDVSGGIYLTGSAIDGLQTTVSAPYPTNTVAPGCIAAFALKLAPSGQSVAYATYLGYSGAQNQPCGGKVGPDFDNHSVEPTGYTVVVDAAGNAYYGGQSVPGLQATAGAVDTGTKIPGVYAFNPLVADQASHAFVTKVNPSGTSIVYTARIGGSLRDRATSLALDGAGAVVVAGKTSSPDLLGYSGYFPYTGVDCMLDTPEVGFLGKLSSDGARMIFLDYTPMDGGQLDSCQGRYDGTLRFEPAKVLLDPAGNILVAGYTVASKRYTGSTPDAIMPAPSDIQSGQGNQLFQIWSPDGSKILYSTTLPKNGVQGIGIDAYQNIVIANDDSIQRIVAGRVPVDLSLPAMTLCTGQPIAITARIAGSNDIGTVDFQVDGLSIGTAPIVNAVATKSQQLATGVRKLKAFYHGTGLFDGYSSFDIYAAVNQAGICP